MAQPIPCRSIDLSEQFDRTYPRIYKYFRYRGADVDTANDLASTAFERALARLSSFDPRKAAFDTWLFAIAHNLAINHWKARARARIVPLEAAAAQPGTDPPPEETLILQERIGTLLESMRALEEREREIVALKFGGALHNRQIADLDPQTPLRRCWGGDRELGPGLLPRRAGVVCPGTGPVVDTSTRVGARQVSNGQELFSVYGHNTYSRSGLSPDKDRTVFGGFEDGRAQVRSVVENRLLFELEGHTGMVLAARYSPVGEQVATASMDGSVRLWQAEDGSPLATLTGHNGPVCAIQYSPDGAQMASIGDDAVLRIWVVRDGRLLKSIEPDQKMIVISQSDGLVSLWGVPTGQ